MWRAIGLRRRSVPRREQPNTWLHLLLAAGILLYLYSPFLDHWLGKDVYSRPHTHVHVADGALSQLLQLRMIDAAGDHSDHGEHDEHDDGFLCLLDIDALLSLLHTFSVPSPDSVSPHNVLVGGLAPTCLDVSLIYLGSLDPPPNF